jgi:hypothetical protein
MLVDFIHHLVTPLAVHRDAMHDQMFLGFTRSSVTPLAIHQDAMNDMTSPCLYLSTPITKDTKITIV